MIVKVSASHHVFAAQIHEVAMAAYAVEGALIESAHFPPLRETEEEVRRSHDQFLVCLLDERVVGVLSYGDSAEPIEITRLVVSPPYHRQGIASALLAEFHRTISPAHRVIVSTARANTPAICLYEREGYTLARESISREGIALIHLERAATAPALPKS